MKNSKVLIKLISIDKIRYLITGGSSAFLEYSSFIGLNILINNIVLSNAISFLIGLLFSFYLHKIWTFKGEHKNDTKKQAIGYFSLALINVLLTSIIISFIVGTLRIPPFVGKILCMIMVVIWNYLILNKVIFKKADIL